jgi:beta-phosphoglucomutase
LRVPPANCLVFEDAEAGIQAAHAGGMKAVGIGRPETVPDAERIVSSLAEIHYADLIALMMNSNGEKP